MSTIVIREGQYRTEKVFNETFVLVEGYKQGKKGGFVTVVNNGRFEGFPEKVKIKVKSSDMVTFTDGGSIPSTMENGKPIVEEDTRTDEEIKKDISRKFDMLHDLTRGAVGGDIRAMIVVGPPGVGKSFGVEQELDKCSLLAKTAGRPIPYNVVKGAATGIGLYVELYKYKDAGNVLVFDDCDTPLHDELCLNLLKGALDSGKSRKVSWNADSHTLKREGIPNEFEFRGSVIIITNTKFDNIRSPKLRDHLDALMSRAHYLDLTLDTPRQKILRIQGVAETGELFSNYDFTAEQEKMVLDYVYENADKLSEVSLRMAIKIADLLKGFPEKWQDYAQELCWKRRTQN